MDALTTPLNWQRVRLGDIGKPCMCKRVMKHQTTRYGEIPFYKIGTFGNTADAFISKKLFLEYKTKYSFPKKGDILISASGTIGRAVIYDGKPAYFQDSNIVWIDNDETLVKNDFLFYAYSNLPPLNEQIAIANILSGLDRYLYSLRALILKKESVKKALSFELLSQRKRLKGFNQAWQRVRLGDIAEIKRGVRITKNELDVFGKYPVVSGGVGFLGYTNNFNRYENTITIAQYGTAGYVNFQKNKFWANDVCFCIYPNKDIIKNIFLYYFLKVNQNYLYEISNRNATPYSISKDKILDFEILLPPLNEQIAIANILSGLDNEIISLKNKKRQFENIKKALNHDLMSAKIRVLKK
ncbi:restriction endonuclease subunit S [Helicobacter pylori]|uniref:restriction endonuclease subunit S n=1 Tax=Helicobacter pylori TaxID=210 RepID=UPI000BE979FB|nr:restriction endonuclease subunit S [Helicobacter pylori]PDW57341.1 restriction endonuclease subunit S [Helicobacter pylori]